MECVLVLISDPAAPAVTADMVTRAQQLLPAGSAPTWLNDGVACELVFTETNSAELSGLEQALRSALEPAPIDIALLPANGRRKALLLADMDSTIIGQECIDELGALSGLGGRITDITARAMRGELAFSAALRERVGLMKGIDASSIERVIAERITFTHGGSTLVQTMRANGAYAALVSGGFDAFTAFVARETGFDEHRGNQLIIADGMLTGAVAEPILGRFAKLETLHELTARRDIATEDVVAVGDGANDLDMLSAAGLGVAFRAKPIVAEAAQIRIDHGDLTALLYLQGYHANEFVKPARTG